jgi:beta-phosphoglucomutase
VSLRAIVFDFDGVIANSEPLHFRAYRDLLAIEGLDFTESDYYARYLGYDDVEAFGTIAADRGLSWTREQVEELVSRKARRLEELERPSNCRRPRCRSPSRPARLVPRSGACSTAPT